ncbi:MAG TPA: heme-binding protein [Aeromonadales bacterium]|nr:heme-binding protein [Aeromonadales bacterium]
MNVIINQQSITAEAAHIAVEAAVEKARQLDILINVEVVDSAGLPMAFLRMPGAFIHSIEIAKDKAFTSASFGFPTSQWKDIFEEDEMLKTGMPGRDRLVVFGGGLPIRVNDQLIGAIGVSGGSAEQDVECAEAGIKAILQQNE